MRKDKMDLRKLLNDESLREVKGEDWHQDKEAEDVYREVKDREIFKELSGQNWGAKAKVEHEEIVGERSTFEEGRPACEVVEIDETDEAMLARLSGGLSGLLYQGDGLPVHKNQQFFESVAKLWARSLDRETMLQYMIKLSVYDMPSEYRGHNIYDCRLKQALGNLGANQCYYIPPECRPFINKGNLKWMEYALICRYTAYEMSRNSINVKIYQNLKFKYLDCDNETLRKEV